MDLYKTQKRIYNVERLRTVIYIQFLVLYYTSCTLHGLLLYDYTLVKFCNKETINNYAPVAVSLIQPLNK